MNLRTPLRTMAFATLCVCAATLSDAAPKTAPQPKISPQELVGPVSDYKIYVLGEVGNLITATRAFADAVKGGDVAKAQSLFAPTRVYYERIEPIAELFSDLDRTIDGRADAFAKKEADPGFLGFHRIEYGLFAKKSADGLAPIADKLVADVGDLQERIKGMAVPPEKMVGGAAVLIEEVAKTKISGEEDRYSRTDLSDFNANIEGAKKIHDLLRPLTSRADPKLVARVDANFAKVEAVLARYAAPGGGFVSYEKLSKGDRTALRGPITALAEDLSKLRGTLGLN